MRLNRAVALAEVVGAAFALREIEAMDGSNFENFLPYHAVHADLLNRTGRIAEARAAYDAALTLDPAPAERRWLESRRGSLARADGADGCAVRANVPPRLS